MALWDGKLDLRPTCSATHILLLVDCKAPL